MTAAFVSVMQEIPFLLWCLIIPTLSVLVCLPLSFSKLHYLVCIQPRLTHPTSVQTCNATHTDFFFHCCQGGQLGTMLVCSFAAHFRMPQVWLAGRQAEPVQMARVGSGRAASDILWGKMDQTMHPDIVSALATIWLHDKLPGNFCLPACIPVPKQHLKKMKGDENVWGTVWIVCFLNNK